MHVPSTRDKVQASGSCLITISSYLLNRSYKCIICILGGPEMSSTSRPSRSWPCNVLVRVMYTNNHIINVIHSLNLKLNIGLQTAYPNT